MHKSKSITGWIVEMTAAILLIVMEVAPVASQNQELQQAPDERKGTAEWLKFSPQGAPFSVSFPAPPGEKSKDEKDGIKLHNYKLKSGQTEYQMVWFTNLPYNVLQRGPLNVLFPRALEDILKSAKQAGKKDLVTTHQDDIMLNGYHGRESTMESGSDRIEAKGFIAGRDFIGIAVLHPKEESSAADAKRFLESLSLPDLRTVGTGASPQDVDTRPVPLNHPRPDYSEKARRNGVQGSIRIRALIGVDGLVKDVKLLTHLPNGLDEEAAKAVRQMQFRPATKAGQPVPFWQILEVDFNLRKRNQ